MREFRINEFLSLRLEGEWTNIYVGKVQFRQCTILLLNIIEGEESKFDKVESIDEAAEMVGASMENSLDLYKFIPPETEFWGHCSNLQVWYEHDYDTRLIHSNLAFPLLRKLTEAGDPLAKVVFKTEIVKRYKNGTDTTRDFLEIEKFLYYLPVDERLHLMVNENDFSALLELSEEIFPNVIAGTTTYSQITQFLSNLIESEEVKIENGQVMELNLWNLKMDMFPKSILKFKSLKVLNLRNNKLKEIPLDIAKLRSLRELWLSNNKLVSLPDSICNFKNLERLWLDENKLESLPKDIGNFKNLRFLTLTHNLLNKLPESICKLKKLENLLISDNLLTKLPECLTELKSLKYISLERNCFKEYPEVLKKIENLEREIKVNFDLGK